MNKLLTEVGDWPDNVFTDKLKIWLTYEDTDDEIWPSMEICNICASLSCGLAESVHMVPDSDGGVVFHFPMTDNESLCYHVWDDGEIESIKMVNGKVYDRSKLNLQM